VVALALLAASTAGCSSPSHERQQPRALLIGVDGATNRIITPLIEAGELPHFAELARAGTTGALRPDYPLLSPRVWTSIATGKKPEHHGIVQWVWLDSERRPRLYMGTDRKAHALWNILSDRGHSVGVVNWLMTHPPEKINGVMISDHAIPGATESKLGLAAAFASGLPGHRGQVTAPQAVAPYAHPQAWTHRVESLLRDEHPKLTDAVNPFAGAGWPDIGFVQKMRAAYDDDELVVRIALAVDREIRPDLLMVYLPGVDRVSHFLWDAVEPTEAIPPDRRLPPDVLAKHGNALRSYYRFVDAVIGRLTAERGEDDLVMVISDHGFELGTEHHRTPGIHESDRARDGILYVRGRAVPRGLQGAVLGMNDVAPTVLAWFGLGYSEDMNGKPAQFLQLKIPPPVATYETTAIERVGEARPEVEEVIIDRLRELGYVEKGSRR
jgi:hypothetical protein